MRLKRVAFPYFLLWQDVEANVPLVHDVSPGTLCLVLGEEHDVFTPLAKGTYVQVLLNGVVGMISTNALEDL